MQGSGCEGQASALGRGVAGRGRWGSAASLDSVRQGRREVRGKEVGVKTFNASS